jgi:crotonobetainyl-CoA:carnitine CoA-transferase CaiB-like acyl-CoA transferase
MLADYGADVIKIERPGGGDPARAAGPFLNDEPHPEKCILFSHLNLNKRGITLDLKSDTGKKIVKDLVKDTDIAVESFSPGVMARLGLDYETLKEINPKLVMTSITNFGQTGPYRDFKASELTLSGLGYDQYSYGLDGREPLKLGGNAEQYQCGHMATVATLGGYWLASTQGIGNYIDCSMQEMLAVDTDHKSFNLLNYAYFGRAGMGRRDPRSAVADISPTGIFPCKDGYVQLSIGIGMWDRFLRLMQRPELDALKFPEDIVNLDNKPIVDAIWYPWCLERTKQEIMEECQAYKVFGTAIKTPREALEDPHLAERGFWVEVEHPVSGKQIYPGAPCDFPDAPWAVTRPAPMLGQHNEEVYVGQLGYLKDDLAKMSKANEI